MMREAEASADDEKKRRAEAEARNQADNLVYQTEKMLGEHGDKLPAADKDEIQNAIDETKEALKGSDAQAINDAAGRLSTAAQKIGQAMYASQQAAGAAGAEQGQAANEPPQGDVVDAEIVDEGEGA